MKPYILLITAILFFGNADCQNKQTKKTAPDTTWLKSVFFEGGYPNIFKGNPNWMYDTGTSRRINFFESNALYDTIQKYNVTRSPSTTVIKHGGLIEDAGSLYDTSKAIKCTFSLYNSLIEHNSNGYVVFGQKFKTSNDSLWYSVSQYIDILILCGHPIDSLKKINQVGRKNTYEWKIVFPNDPRDVDKPPVYFLDKNKNVITSNNIKAAIIEVSE